MPNKKAVIVTAKGTIEADLFADEVPNTVANFEKLANSRFYNGTKFHRVIPNFMIQCGDPLSRYPDMAGRWGTGGPGYRFEDEFHPELKHDGPGVLSMANSGPKTNGAQWFITEAATKHLDGKHSVFGRVVSGQDVAKKIANVPTTRDRPNTDVVLQSVELYRQ